MYSYNLKMEQKSDLLKKLNIVNIPQYFRIRLDLIQKSRKYQITDF